MGNRIKYTEMNSYCLKLPKSFNIITILVIRRQDYRKERAEMALEIVTDGKNDKTEKRIARNMYTTREHGTGHVSCLDDDDDDDDDCLYITLFSAHRADSLRSHVILHE